MRVAILAEGQFAPATAKTAVGVLRYAPFEVVAVVDSTRAGKDAAECVGVGTACGGCERRRRDRARRYGRAHRHARRGRSYPRRVPPSARARFGARRRRLERLARARLRRSGAVAAARAWPCEVRDCGSRRWICRSGAIARAARARASSDGRIGRAVGKMTASLEIVVARCVARASAEFVATGQTGSHRRGRDRCRRVVRIIAGAAELMVWSGERADW